MFMIEFSPDGIPLRARIPVSSLPPGTYCEECPSNAVVRKAMQPGWKLDRTGWRNDADGSLFWPIEPGSPGRISHMSNPDWHILDSSARMLWSDFMEAAGFEPGECIESRPSIYIIVGGRLVSFEAFARVHAQARKADEVLWAG